MKDLLKKFWPFFSLVLIVCLFFWKVFVKGLIPFPGDFVVGIYYPWLDYKWGYTTGVPVKNPIVADVPSFMYPMQTLAVNLLKNGSWPLWNPFILAGVPLLANFQSAPFSPTVIYYFLFGNTTAWSLQIITAHFLAALFTFFLLREWKVSKMGSVLGGIIFAFSGYNLIWSQWNGHTLAAAFIPLILLFEDRWLNKRNILGGIGLAIAFCLQIVSGYPQTIIYTAVAAGLLWFVRLRQIKKAFSTTLFLALFYILGIGLAAPQVLTGMELLKLSQWTAELHPFGWAFLPWQKIITFLAPDYFGNHATGNYWGLQDYTSNTGFVGVVAFVLAGFGTFFFKEKREVKFSLLLLLITLVLSFPTFISIFLWKNNLLGMGSSSAHRALVLFNLSVALLAGFGLDSLKSRYKSKNLIIVFALPLFLILSFGIHALSTATTVALRNLVLPIGFLFASSLIIFSPLRHRLRLVLLALCLLELFRFGWKFTPFSSPDFVFPKTPVLEFLSKQEKPFRITGSKIIPVNLSMPYGFESLEGYETMRPYYISQLIASINKNSSTASPAGRYGILDNDTSPLLDLVNTKYYLTLKKDIKRFDPKRFTLAFEDKSVAVMESKSVLPRSFRVYQWEVEKDGKKTLDKLLDPKYPYAKKIILEEDPGKVDSLLFVSDAYYPGWKAFVDGHEAKIYRANFAFRAVPVPAGEHEIKFVYQPKSFFDGLKISVLSLAILLLLLGLWKRKP